MKRIALVGNVNNNFFAITRHLRDRGYDAHLFYRAEGAEHFQPQADTYTTDYESYCHRVHWLKNGVVYIDEEQIKTALQGFDFYIGQSDEAAAAYRAGINMDVYYPYGSDVYKYARLPQEFLLKQKILHYSRSINFGNTYSKLKKGTGSKSLRGVITNAKNILAEYTNEDMEATLRSLNYKGIYHNSPMPFIYDKEYDNIESANSKTLPWENLVDNARKENDLLILYHGRQEWKTIHNEFTSKNTHHLILGLAGYLKKNPSSKICLIMLEYGYDQEHSKALIKELGIDNYVIWLPKMYRKEIMHLISKVDVCTGEYVRSYLTFGTIIEAMLMKKPIIHYREDSLYTHIYPELYPMLNAREPDEIETAIGYALNNPRELKKMGEAASAWVRKYFIEKPLQTLQNLIETK